MVDSQPPADSPKMSVRGATFLGVGSMVGAGIFTLLGEAGAVAGSATWVSFLLAGILTMLLGYTVVKLGVRYPSSGGFIAYLREGYGDGHMLGIASWLGFFALAIMSAMVSVSFGEYTSLLLIGEDADPVWAKSFATVLIVAMAWVNLRGSAAVDKSQTLIVTAVLVVFAVFVVAAFRSLDPDLLSADGYPPAVDILSSVALTFFAFLGFAVITFSAGELRDPDRELGRAMYMAIGITTIVYVAVALGVFGTLSVAEVIDSGATAIAVAAEPSLGDAGFTLVAIAAMLATASSTNANLFAAGHLTEMLGRIHQFPDAFAATTRRGWPGGLTITTLVVLVMANAFDLTAIASIGTAIALGLFVLLTIAGIRLRAETGARLTPMLLAIFAILVVLTLFVIDTLESEPTTVYAMVALTVLAVVFDLSWKRVLSRRDEPKHDVGVPSA